MEENTKHVFYNCITKLHELHITGTNREHSKHLDSRSVKGSSGGEWFAPGESLDQPQVEPSTVNSPNFRPEDKNYSLPATNTEESCENQEEYINANSTQTVGKALVVNIRTHSDPGYNRKGSDKDFDDMTDVLKLFGFEVLAKEDLKKDELENDLKELAQNKNNEGYQSCLVVIMSHGDEGNILTSDVQKLPRDSVMKDFIDEKSSWTGKPKLFFFAQCHGNTHDKGKKVRERPDSTKSDKIVSLIPTGADIFVVYSSIAGYVSMRDLDEGTWFIQAFVAVCNKLNRRTDLCEIMTRVIKQVQDKETAERREKQSPAFCSTMGKKYYLYPNQRESRESEKKKTVIHPIRSLGSNLSKMWTSVTNIRVGSSSTTDEIRRQRDSEDEAIGIQRSQHEQ